MSEYIRRRNADKEGHIFCYTCGVKLHYKEANASHLFHNRLDLHKDNLKACCVKCNQWLSRNLAEYTIRLTKEIGIEKVEALKLEANTKGNNYSVEELIGIIHSLQIELSQLNTSD